MVTHYKNKIKKQHFLTYDTFIVTVCVLPKHAHLIESLAYLHIIGHCSFSRLLIPSVQNSGNEDECIRFPRCPLRVTEDNSICKLITAENYYSQLLGYYEPTCGIWAVGGGRYRPRERFI